MSTLAVPAGPSTGLVTIDVAVGVSASSAPSPAAGVVRRSALGSDWSSARQPAPGPMAVSRSTSTGWVAVAMKFSWCRSVAPSACSTRRAAPARRK